MLTYTHLEAYSVDTAESLDDIYYAWIIHLRDLGIPDHEAKPRASLMARRGEYPSDGF